VQYIIEGREFDVVAAPTGKLHVDHEGCDGQRVVKILPRIATVSPLPVVAGNEDARVLGEMARTPGVQSIYQGLRAAGLKPINLRNRSVKKSGSV
jgi:hypothetical protein